MPEIRTMKIIVGLMTLLIAVMTGLIVWKLAQGPDMPEALTAPAVTIPAPTQAWSVSLPEPGTILSMSPAGNNLAVMVLTAQGQRIYLISQQTGRLIGTLKPAEE